MNEIVFPLFLPRQSSLGANPSVPTDTLSSDLADSSIFWTVIKWSKKIELF